MTQGWLRRAHARLVALSLATLPLALAGCRRSEYPQSTFDPHSEFAAWTDRLNWQLIFWVVIIFVVVQTLLTIAVIRFRDRPGAQNPKPVHGHTVLEIAWTIAPAVILAIVAVPTVRTIYRTQGNAPRQDLLVKVVGHQWWWEFQYPELGVVTANEMHVPIGRTVVVDITSADILHSFWIPAMGGKRDAVPTRTNRIWFTPDTLGTFMGQCVEFCGMSHANMRMRLFVESQGDFDAWVAHQKSPPIGSPAPADSSRPSTTAAVLGVPPASAAPAPGASATSASAPADPALVAKGRETFATGACVACHTIDGIAAGIVGPNLNHFASRTTFAGSIFENNPENLGRWLENPPARKPGALMPALGLTPDQVTALVAYLQSLR